MTKGRGAKHVYRFGNGRADGDAGMKNLLGGKGANMAEMTRLGLPVPPGFTITTEVCTHYFENDGRYPATLWKEVEAGLQFIESSMKARLGDAENPLLVSVRSGARASMPGMMDTVLNIGLNDVTVEALAARSGNRRFAWDSYRRFIQMFGDVVLGLKPESKDDHDPFEVIMDDLKRSRGFTSDLDLGVDDLVLLVARFKSAVRERTGRDFPADPREQIRAAVSAVFGSWNNDRATAYRQIHGIPHAWGTAANVQAMVFGNLGATSGTGVLFTRNAASGEKQPYGDYLLNAQGEDVVAGIRPTKKIDDLAREMPDVYRQLMTICGRLERHYRDMQDVEFTIQDGRLFMLQCRNGKRTAFAALRIATDMVAEKLITREEALLRVEPATLEQILRPVFDVGARRAAVEAGRVLARGLNAGPGAASGRVVFNAPDAAEWASRGEKVILVRIETSPEDIKGMAAAEGILTARGGMTSHAAVVGRQMGKTCVVGCGDLDIDYRARRMTVRGRTVDQGDCLSLDGGTGEILEGAIPTIPSEVARVLVERTLDPADSDLYRRFAAFMGWADRARTLRIRTNADQPDQAASAVAFGAEGIGLCRTEHMFFGGDRIRHVRAMILARTENERRAALAALLPLQRQDFAGIFEAMAGRPVTIRTLDPPLHEFLPVTDRDIAETAGSMGISAEDIRRRSAQLHETNPMLGHRGCRLGIVYPEITEMQARAIFLAAADVLDRGLPVKPEIMIPLVADVSELRSQAALVRRVATEVQKERGIRIPHLIGTMIELPRAAVTAGEIAREAEFFSFGTNDLTQTTWGLSRDDAGGFLQSYRDLRIIESDPFSTLDRDGVGALMRIAVREGRSKRPGIKLGICGEHGGDPSSIAFCHELGLEYVSCSPFRVAIARLAAAQAAVRERTAEAVKGKTATKGTRNAAKAAAPRKVAKAAAPRKVAKAAAPRKAAGERRRPARAGR